MSRNYYGPLRDEHQKALDALNNHIEQSTQQPGQEVGAVERGPTRPEDVARQSPGWTQMGGMAQQQASANAWFKAGSEVAQERMAALNRHIDGGASEHTPDKGPDRGDNLSPKPDDIER